MCLQESVFTENSTSVLLPMQEKKWCKSLGINHKIWKVRSNTKPWYINKNNSGLHNITRQRPGMVGVRQGHLPWRAITADSPTPQDCVETRQVCALPLVFAPCCSEDSSESCMRITKGFRAPRASTIKWLCRTVIKPFTTQPSTTFPNTSSSFQHSSLLTSNCYCYTFWALRM